MLRKRNSSSSSSKGRTDAPPSEAAVEAASSQRHGEAVQAKNHKLAKELSESRMKHREEAKNVARLTMENMNLASRCREAIAQAASLKKELSVQKKKTAEAVHQTHQLIAQLKRMSPDRKKSTILPVPLTAAATANNNSKPQQVVATTTTPTLVPPAPVVVTPDVSLKESSSSSTPPIMLEEGDSEHKEDDDAVHILVHHQPELQEKALQDEIVPPLYHHIVDTDDDCRPSEEAKEQTAESNAVTATTSTTAAVLTAPTPMLVVEKLSPSKPDAPASGETEDTTEEPEEESDDTVAEIIAPPADKPAFPVTASPMTLKGRKQHHHHHNDSYDEEYPEEPALSKMKQPPGSSLLSSIDAFEASFNTNFPDSFSPKDEDEGGSSGLYNPFDTTSPTKSDPPSSTSPIPPQPLMTPPIYSHGRGVSPNPSSTGPLSPKSTAHHSTGLEMSPRDTPPRKTNLVRMSRPNDEKSLLVKPLPMSLNMAELIHYEEGSETPRTSHHGPSSSTTTISTAASSPESPDIEVFSPNIHTRMISPTASSLSPRSSSSNNGKVSSYEMVGSQAGNRSKPRSEGPDDETSFHARLRSTQQRVSPTTSAKGYTNVSRFKQSLVVSTKSTADTTKTGHSHHRVAPLSSRSNGSTESTIASEASASSSSPTRSTSVTDVASNHSNNSRFHRAARTFDHVGSAAAKVREIKARNRSVSAPKVRTTTSPPSWTFSENQHHQPDRPQQKLTGYGTARARYERAIQSPKDVSDIPMDDGRQRRNVNLSNRQRRASENVNGTAPLISSSSSPTRVAATTK